MPCMWAVGETEDEREKNNQSHAQLPWPSFAAGHNPNFLRACAPHSWPQRPAEAGLQPWPAFVLCPRAQGSRLCRRNTSSLTYLEWLVHSDRQSRRT